MRIIIITTLSLVGCVSPPLGSTFEDAQSLANRGEFGAAVAVAEPLLLGTTSVSTLEEACGWALKAGRMEQAYDFSNRLIGFESQSWVGHRTRGLALVSLKRLSAAIPDLDFVHRNCPPDSEVQRALGLAMEFVGRDPGKANSLLVLSGFDDDEVTAALSRLEVMLHPVPLPSVTVTDEPAAWTQAAALDLTTTCSVLDEQLRLSGFLLKNQEARALTGDEHASGLRAADRRRDAAALVDLPDEERAAAVLTHFVEVGLLSVDNNKINPDEILQRGQFAQLVTDLLRLLEEDKGFAVGGDGESPFSDMSVRHPRFAVASAACALGVLHADASRRFRPSDPLSGAELSDALDLLREVLLRSPLYQEMIR
jgi:hypothetical protein